MNKIDKIFDRLSSIDVTLAAQHESLKDHIRRTEILEEAFEPVKNHVSMVNGALKFIALCGILATIIEAMHWIIK